MPTFANYLKSLDANKSQDEAAKVAWDTIYERSNQLELAKSSAEVGAWLGRIFDTLPVDPAFESDLNELTEAYRELQTEVKFDNELKPTKRSTQDIDQFCALVISKLSQQDFLTPEGNIDKQIAQTVLTPDVLNNIKHYSSDLDIASHFLRSYALNIMGAIMNRVNTPQDIAQMSEDAAMRNSLLAAEINMFLSKHTKLTVLAQHADSALLTPHTLHNLIDEEISDNLYAQKVVNILKLIENNILEQQLSYKEGRELIQSIAAALTDSANLNDVIQNIGAYAQQDIDFTTFKSVNKAMAAQAEDFSALNSVNEAKHIQSNTFDVDQQVLLNRLETMKLTTKHVDYDKSDTNTILDNIKIALSTKWIQQGSKLINNSDNYRHPEKLQESLKHLDNEITNIVSITEKIFALRRSFKAFLSPGKDTKAIFSELEKQFGDQVKAYSNNYISYSQLRDETVLVLEAEARKPTKGNMHEILLRAAAFCKGKRDVVLDAVPQLENRGLKK